MTVEQSRTETSVYIVAIPRDLFPYILIYPILNMKNILILSYPLLLFLFFKKYLIYELLIFYFFNNQAVCAKGIRCSDDIQPAGGEGAAGKEL